MKPERPTDQKILSTQPTRRGPELVFGIAAAVGSDQDLISRTLEEVLRSVDYNSKVVRLSAFLREVKDWTSKLKDNPEDERIDVYMNAGNDFRDKIGSGDALAVAAIGDIQEERGSNDSNDPPLPRARYAYILRSLKHPEEVDTLRRVYGDGFILLAAYSPRDARLTNLARRIAESSYSSRSTEFREKAERLLKRDEFEAGSQFGQNIRDTFPKADIFIDLSQRAQIETDLARFIELYFGHPFHTPTREEFAMFHAQAAALRSAALPRQVGAAIATEEGDVIAVGTNEVPKAGGGQYWFGDLPDSRDFTLGYETSDKLKRLLLADILDNLRRRLC